jgi:flagellar biosynthesis protein FliQ
MAEYRLIENNKKNLLNKKLAKSLPLIIVAVLAGMGISFFQIAQIYNNHTFKIVILPTLLICVGAIFVGLKFGLKIYKENYLDIVYFIENNLLKVTKKGKDIISATKDDINKIEEYKDETIIIFFKNKQKNCIK